MNRATPSIRISDHLSSRQGSQHRGSHSLYDASSSSSATIATTATAAAMAIPRAREAVPPPLPPPQFIPEISSGRDPGWQWANDPNATDFARPASIKPGSSLLGGFHRTLSQERELDGRSGEHVRRTSSTSTITPPSREVEMTNTHDEGMPANPNHSFKGERRLERSTLEDLSQKYDKHLVSRIGGPNTPSKQSLSGSGIQDPGVQERERRNSLLPALGQAQESARWLPSMSSNGAISPGVAPPWEGPGHTRHNSAQSEAARQPVESQHQEDFPMEDAGSRNEHEVFGSFRIGDKRRASSPPREREELRRQSTLRDAPPARYHPGHASLSSVSSYGGQRHGSLSSSIMSSVPSSATSYASGVSPLAASAMESGPRSGTTGESTSSAHHQRTTSELTQIESKGSPDNRGHSRHGSRSTTMAQGMYVCECCPKKPKKYETEEELRAHESEKQYGCNYCPNRFKNKNEAERHQNSLHLRDHSWSCAALTKYEAAYHSSTTGPASGADVDICGYCGMEFPNPADWKIRLDHLQIGHKVGQCNQQKKFFRADHFRQHLKHTHDGTSGKWTNMLENACMKSEQRHPQQLEEPTTFAASTRMEYLAQPAP